MKRKMTCGLLVLAVIFFTVLLSVTDSSGAEPGSKFQRFVNTGCSCSATIDAGCDGYYATGYCDGTTGTSCTTGIDCIIIYSQGCPPSYKAQEDCSAPN